MKFHSISPLALAYEYEQKIIEFMAGSTTDPNSPCRGYSGSNTFIQGIGKFDPDFEARLADRLDLIKRAPDPACTPWKCAGPRFWTSLVGNVIAAVAVIGAAATMPNNGLVSQITSGVSAVAGAGTGALAGSLVGGAWGAVAGTVLGALAGGLLGGLLGLMRPNDLLLGDCAVYKPTALNVRVGWEADIGTGYASCAKSH